MANHPLGPVQRDVLGALIEHGSWSAGSGWIWTTYGETMRLMRSLEARGLASSREETRPVYGTIVIFTPTDAGRRAATKET